MKNKTILIKFVTIIYPFLLFFVPQTMFSQNKELHQLFDNYYKEKLRFFPIQATMQGDTVYNDLLQNDGSQAFINEVHNFYADYLQKLSAYKLSDLSFSDKISCEILKEYLENELESEQYHYEYMPVNQFSSIAHIMGVFGSNNGSQPFKTVKDYENWLKRISSFNVWVDTAIGNFNKGIIAGIVLPRALVIKTIPQLENLAQDDTSKSIFFNPIRNFPKGFTSMEKSELSLAYYQSITKGLIPAYKKLIMYLKNDYLPHARLSSGYNDITNGKKAYEFYVRYCTTTNKSPEEIYQIGLKEVNKNSF